MPRVTRGPRGRRRRKKVLKQTRGYRGARSKLWQTAVEALHHAWSYQYEHRKAKKRLFRRLWNIRIGAAAKANDLSYSKFIHGLKLAGVSINRKMLAAIATQDPAGFRQLAEMSRTSVSA
ncbi:MAG: 50S ribosomal protein L20 [Pseudomonadota bacterium]